MKKLLIVTPYFYPHMGGLENYAYNISKGLSKKYKWHVSIITTNHIEKKFKKEQIDGLKIYRLPYWIKISNTPINPLWYFQIKKIIKEEKPDVINAHAPVPFIADIAAFVSGKVPFILAYHAGTMKKGNFFFDLIISIYEKIFLQITCRKAKKIICSSEFVKNTIVKKYSFKNIVISPAVDTSIFKPKKINKKRINPTVLFIGRHANMYRMKGLYYLIDAVKKIPNVKLRIVGEKIDLKEKNIEFIGIKRGKELVEEIQKTNILVLSSLAHMESFGMVLIEAMACKTPVIGTKIGGIPEVISHGKDGLLVPPKNLDALKKAIDFLINNPIEAKKMGENGYRKIKNNYVWDKKVQQTNKILRNLI